MLPLPHQEYTPVSDGDSLKSAPLPAARRRTTSLRRLAEGRICGPQSEPAFHWKSFAPDYAACSPKDLLRPVALAALSTRVEMLPQHSAVSRLAAWTPPMKPELTPRAMSYRAFSWMGILTVGALVTLPPATRADAPLFGPKTDFATGTGPGWLAIGDLNGDSLLDLAVTNFSSFTV